MKKPSRPRPVLPRYKDQLHRLARRIFPWASTPTAREDQLAAIRALLALLEKEPRLPLNVGEKKRRAPQGIHDSLLFVLPGRLYLYRADLPPGQPLKTLHRLMAVHGADALRFHVDEGCPMTNEDVLDLRTLGLDGSDPAHHLMLFQLGHHSTFFPALQDILAEGRLDALKPWSRGATDPRADDTGGVLARSARHARYLHALFSSGLAPDACHLRKIHHRLTIRGEEVVESLTRPRETVVVYKRFEASHQTLLQALVIGCLLGRSETRGDPVNLEKALVCLEFGADPDFVPAWSQYLSPRRMVDEGIRLIEAAEGPAMTGELHRLKMAMDDLGLARTLKGSIAPLPSPSTRNRL
jgi:hypothetical protein